MIREYCTLYIRYALVDIRVKCHIYDESEAAIRIRGCHANPINTSPHDSFGFVWQLRIRDVGRGSVPAFTDL